MAEFAPKQNKTTVFDRMEFPKYEYREFPMAVPVLNGKVQDSPYDERRKPFPVVIVNSQEELNALKAGDAKLAKVNPQAVETASRVENEDDQRDALYLRADQLGVKVDKRWSIDRIEKAIAEAEKPVL